jgi:hypothetical protein
MPEPRDRYFYNRVKNEISNKYKHSAYRSGMINKKYKEEYMKKYNRADAYIGIKPKLSNFERWFSENMKGVKLDIKIKMMYIDLQ